MPSSTPTPLSATRAKDRAIMAKQITELAQSLGCTVTESEMVFGKKGVRLDILAPGGLRVGLELPGFSSTGSFVLHWNLRAHDNPSATLDPAFWCNINTVHYCKATDVANDFEDLLRVLKMRWTGAQDGSAYKGSSVAAA